MKSRHALESGLAQLLAAGVRSLPRRASLAAGRLLGDLAGALGLRRRVAEENLARAFPEKSAAEREGILRAHYRELGLVCVEYCRMPELVRAPDGRVVAEARGMEHLERAQREGRGAILLTGHFGNFELLGAWLGRRHPVDFVVQPLSNPGVERMLAGWRTGAGVGQIPRGSALRRVFESLRANRWVAMVADQDARERGVFVPFFGVPASTPVGPAEIALRAGAPIVMGFDVRRPDGRHELEVDAPLPQPAESDPDAALRLTAAHTARLEARVRERPEAWFWLHRRWKTRPPMGG